MPSRQPSHNHAILAAAPRLVEVRGPSGRLYGLLDPRTMVLHVKTGRGGKHTQTETEPVDLSQYLSSERA